MLKASQDRRYNYNRTAALESARETSLLYQVFRPALGFQSLICKLVDFQAFTAAMLLVLNVLGSPTSNSQRNKEDDSRDWGTSSVPSAHNLALSSRHLEL